MSINTDQWMKEVLSHKSFFQTLEDSLPVEFMSIQERKQSYFARLN
jgi:hypothetical protein